MSYGMPWLCNTFFIKKNKATENDLKGLGLVIPVALLQCLFLDGFRTIAFQESGLGSRVFWRFTDQFFKGYIGFVIQRNAIARL